MAKHRIREELLGILSFVGIIWCVFVFGHALPIPIESFGIVPRTLRGLVGIPLAPFLHANLWHLTSNTIPLMVLLLLLVGSRARSWSVVVWIVLLGGALLWLLGGPATHIGASSLIYGLIAFLLVSGVREQRIVPMIISLVVGFLYGGTLVFGVLPRLSSQISWEGHLSGALAGGIVAYFMPMDRDRVEETVVRG